jgi:putative NADH-flavin reductase
MFPTISKPSFIQLYMSSMKPLRVGVIGSTGFGGSYLCVELLNRGHTVIGISRNPEKLGKHERYIPRPVDIDEVSVEELAKKFEGIDVLVSEYGPHTAGAGALLYSTYNPTFLETIAARQEGRDDENGS